MSKPAAHTPLIMELLHALRKQEYAERAHEHCQDCYVKTKAPAICQHCQDAFAACVRLRRNALQKAEGAE